MGAHPINLILRFILELTALYVTGLWGWKLCDSWLHFVSGFGIPLLISVLWGVFAVPNDPSRSGSAPVPIRGYLRLLMELAIFAFATWTLFNMGNAILGWIFGLIVLFHYIISYNRVIWLIEH